MKRVLLLLLVSIGLRLTSLAQPAYANLAFEPARPKPGQTIGIVYDPRGTSLADAQEIEAIAYLYDGIQFKAFDVPLARNGAVLKGTIRTEATTDGVAFRFQSDGVQDHNQKQGYFSYLYNDAGKPVPGALGGRATAYLTWGSNFLETEQPADTAAALFGREIAAYPASEATFLPISLHLLGQQEPDEAKAKAAALRKLDAIAGQKNLTPQVLASLAYGYERYDQAKAEKYRALALQRDPKGEFAAQQLFTKGYGAQDPAQKLALLAQLEKDFPKSVQFIMLSDHVANGYLEKGDTTGLRQFLARHGQYLTARLQQYIAGKLLEGDNTLPLAEQLAIKAVAKARHDLAQPVSERPPYNHEKEWRAAQGYVLGAALSTHAAVLLKRGKTEEGYAAAREAIAVTNEAVINDQYVAIAVRTKRYQEALTAGEQFIPAGKSSAKMKEELRQAYVAVHGNEKGYDRYLASLEAPLREKLKKSLRAKMISEPAPNFTLQDLAGNPVSLAGLKGKTVVIDFWATWCGPCIASMPAMQQAVNKYKDDPGVAFLFINAWQREDDKQQVVRAFLEKKQYRVTVPMDLDDKVITAYKVEGIPTKFVIDPQGNIRFKSAGFDGSPDAMAEELSLMIDLAAGKGQ